MTTDPDRPPVPGLEPADGRTPPLDPTQDPDRFVPEDHPRVVEPVPDTGRDLPPGQGQTLKDLLGETGGQEGGRDGYQWVAGLLGVFAFLALVAWLFNDVLTP